MTSRFGAHECFVYITLAGQTEFVTAGRFVLEQQRGGPLGRFVRRLGRQPKRPLPLRKWQKV